MDLSRLPIVDHHAHPLLRIAETYPADNFRRWFSESTAPEIHARHVPHTLFFRTAVRWLAELLDCAPELGAVLEARTRQDEVAWTRRLFLDANIEILLSDYGYGSAAAYNHVQMQELLPCRVEPMLRLETMAEQLILRHDTFEAMIDAYVETVTQARAAGYVALKSIIAYRSGLVIDDSSRGCRRFLYGPKRKGSPHRPHSPG